jgi:hypothetical protein
MKYGYLVTEGPHDVEFFGKILKKRFELKRVELLSELDRFWHPLIPRNFPPDGNNFLKRVPIPVFFQNHNHSVAIHSAGSDTRLIQTIQESSVLINPEQLTGIGLVADADISATEQFNSLKKTADFFSLPDNPGEILKTSPKIGVFILPDNSSEGTLEDILLKCAETSYPSLLDGAYKFVNTTDLKVLSNEDIKDFNKPSGKKKSVVGCISSILRPGKAVQVSVQDNRWIDDNTLELPHIRSIIDFLSELLELSDTKE